MHSQIDSIVALQRIHGLVPLMRALSVLGSEEFYLLLLTFVYLCVDARLGVRLGLVVLLGDAVNKLVKIALAQPRPYWLDPRVHAWAAEKSFGIPSGHAQNGVAVWLFLAGRSGKRRAYPAAIALVLLISLSRVYLGVHFWTDLLAGWLVGGLFLWFFLKISLLLVDRFERQTIPLQLSVATGLAAMILLAGLCVDHLPTGVAGRAAWARFADPTPGWVGLVAPAGAVWGVLFGWALAMRWARFDAGGPWSRRWLRLLLGLTGVLLFRLGLPALLPGAVRSLAAVRFIRYVLMAGWVVLVAPWLSLRWGFARAEPAEGLRS